MAFAEFNIDMNFDDFLEYPFVGRFWHIEENNFGSDTEIELYDGEVDIKTQTDEIGNVAVEANYLILLPLQKDEYGKQFNPIRRGDLFEGERYGEKFKGKVINVEVSIIGGISVLIQRTYWDDEH